jgi:hypothetical protein
VAMMAVLLDDENGAFCVRQELVAKLARLGITNVALVRDDETVGVILEGWLFDPARSGAAAADAVATAGVRVLHPVLDLAVSAAAYEGGRDVEAVS